MADVSQRGDWNRPRRPSLRPAHRDLARDGGPPPARGRGPRAAGAGEVREINDLITYNLDIHQFAQDVIEWSEGPELVRAFWKALTDIKVLDPTCGIGRVPVCRAQYSGAAL